MNTRRSHRNTPSRLHGLAWLTATALLTGSPAFASDGVRSVFGLSITGGGDTLATVQYSNGTNQSIKSGGLTHLFGGVEYRVGAFAMQGNVGYHTDSSSATNGTLRFSRVPLEGLAFWQPADNFRIGGGLRKAFSAKFKGSGAASGFGSQGFDSSVGLVLQGEYLFSGGRYGLLARYVSEKYKDGGFSVDGNHAGLGFTFRF